jgi:deferrochelatase/peroxidase EfeB
MAPDLSRRRFLQAGAAGTVLGVGGTLAGALLSPSAGAQTAGAFETAQAVDATPATDERIPFHGPHQPGILRAAAPAATFVSYDVLADRADQLRQLLIEITERARLLTFGGRMTSEGPTSTRPTTSCSVPKRPPVASP